jgi:transcriptional regulator with XRE-family HTH domain
MLTDLGKMIKNLCTNADLKQEQLAAKLGCSPGTLSNYMNGKAAPDMDILAKIVDRFGLKEKELKNLFSKAFFSAVQNNQKIVLDTRFFRKGRVETLVQFIVALLLLDNKHSSSTTDIDPTLFSNIIRNIKGSYNAMDIEESLKLIQPSQGGESA